MVDYSLGLWDLANNHSSTSKTPLKIGMVVQICLNLAKNCAHQNMYTYIMREGVEKLHITCSVKGCVGAHFMFRDIHYDGLLNNSRFLRELADDESLQVEATVQFMTTWLMKRGLMAIITNDTSYPRCVQHDDVLNTIRRRQIALM